MILLFFSCSSLISVTNYLFESLRVRFVPFRRLFPALIAHRTSVVRNVRKTSELFSSAERPGRSKLRIVGSEFGATEELFDRARGHSVHKTPNCFPHHQRYTMTQLRYSSTDTDDGDFL